MSDPALRRRVCQTAGAGDPPHGEQRFRAKDLGAVYGGPGGLHFRKRPDARWRQAVLDRYRARRGV